MTYYSMPLGYKLVTSLAMAMLFGCSADGGSTGAGAGGSAGNNGTTTGGGGAGGAGGNVSNVYQPVTASNQDNIYTLQMGPIKLVVDASVGARITEFSYDGTNVLTGPEVDTNVAPPAHNNYGSTYWPSPQSSWYANSNWPPIPAIDNQPYTGSIDTSTKSIQLVSATALIGKFANSQVTVTKTLTPVPESGAIDITYTLTNISTSVSLTVAPWEISRVRGTGGMTFFGKGSGSVTYPSGRDTASFAVTDDNSGILWYDFAPVTANSKAMADGTGWIAHATADNLLYLLSYLDIQSSEAATGEAEVEIFTGINGDYVEIEPQGPLTAIGPGVSLNWKVRWKLRQIPGGTAVAVGSTDLATFAQQQLSQ